LLLKATPEWTTKGVPFLGKGRRDVSERFKRKTGFESPRTPQDK